MNNTNITANEDINKIKILKIFFNNIVADGKIDSSEKSIFARLKENFELSDKICSDLLAEALKEKKEKKDSNKFILGLPETNVTEREQKKILYANVLFEMLTNGKISEEENKLLAEFEKLIELTEDQELEARTLVHSKIISCVSELIKEKKFDDALMLLSSFKPDRQFEEQYYKAAFEYIKNVFKTGIKSCEPHTEYKNLFMNKSDSKPAAENFVFHEYYYYCKLINIKNNFSLKELELNKLLETSSNDKQKFLVLFELGFLYHISGKFDLAAERYKKAFDINPQDSELIINMTSCLLSQKKFDDALLFADNALALINDNPMILNNAAIVNAKLKKYDKAITLFEKALNINNNFSDARLNLVLALIEQKKYDDIKKHAEILEQQIPDDPLLCKIKKQMRNFYK